MPFVFSMMVKLGMATQEIPPEKQFGLSLNELRFKPSGLQYLLNPYNPLHLTERLPKPEYNDNEKHKTYMD